MLFSSLTFLFVFLPLLLLVYFIAPSKFRNQILLFFSLIFYSWGGVSYTVILILSIVINYLFSRQIESSSGYKKRWLYFGLSFNILVIIIFKYLDFILQNLNWVNEVVLNSSSQIPLQHIVLPLGISFFTFQQMSLLWDIYRDPETPKVNLVNTALYISLFPQLIAGPIVRYHDIIDQIENRTVRIELFKSGIQRFILGLFKKIIIANSCGALADLIIDSPINTINTPVAWLGIIAYSFQIYFDFSGYSDMAIGLGRMFGFRILENFNLPYISKNIKEFWRRWHISLSTWFRDYVYIPIGGNRLGIKRTYLNLVLVFLLTGFWHGATWSFVVWGLFHGLFLVIEKLGLERVLTKLPNPISWAYTMLVVTFGWVLFRIEELPDAIIYMKKLIGFGVNSNVHLISFIDRERILILVLASLASSPFFIWIQNSISKHKLANSSFLSIATDIGYVALFLISVVYINSGSYNPFIYFRF